MKNGRYGLIKYWWTLFKIKILPKIVGRTIRYGVFSKRTLHRDRRGYVEIGVIVGSSGLYAGAPPNELMIENVFPLQEIDMWRQVIRETNKTRDLPSYVGKAKIRVYGLEIT